MPAAIPIAMVAAAAIGAAASNSAAKKQVAAADRATNLQRDATNFQEQQLIDTKHNLQPYMDAAQPALGELKQGTSQGGEFNRPIDVNDINSNISPDYGFVQSQGELGVNRQNAAQGLYGSGAASKAMAQYDTGLASQYANTAFHNYQDSLAARFERLQKVAGMGQNAAAGEGGLTNQAAGNVISSTSQAGQNIIGAGNASAAGIVGGANAVSSPLNTIGTLGLLKQYGVSPTEKSSGGNYAPVQEGGSGGVYGVNNSAGGNLGVTYGIGGQEVGTG